MRRDFHPMEHHGAFPSRHGLEQHGLEGVGRIFWNLSPAALYEQALCRREAYDCVALCLQAKPGAALAGGGDTIVCDDWTIHDSLPSDCQTS